MTRRIGSSPAQRGSLSGDTCPDVFELDNGDFYIVGAIAPAVLESPEGIQAVVGPDEQAVIVPRRVLVDAARQLKEEGIA